MSIHKQVDAAIVRKDDLINAVYKFAEHGHVPFSECLSRADAMTRERYQDASLRLHELEHTAIVSGKAQRGAFGMLIWSR